MKVLVITKLQWMNAVLLYGKLMKKRVVRKVQHDARYLRPVGVGLKNWFHRSMFKAWCSKNATSIIHERWTRLGGVGVQLWLLVQSWTCNHIYYRQRMHRMHKWGCLRLYKFPVGRWCNSAVWKINFEKKELSEGRSSTLTRRNRLQIMRLGRPLRLDENKNCFSDMGAHRLRYQSLAKQIHAHSTAMPCITKWAHGYGRVMVVPSWVPGKVSYVWF